MSRKLKIDRIRPLNFSQRTKNSPCRREKDNGKKKEESRLRRNPLSCKLVIYHLRFADI